MRFLIGLILFFSSFLLQAQSTAKVYIDKFDSLALEVLNTYGIPASLVLGIALQESAAGTSKLCRVKHNHFGVKGRVKSSKTKSGYTTTYRKFDSDEAAYLYFGEMISKKKYYPSLKGNMDYMKWLKAMKAAGYASSSKWISYVDKMIKRYDLTCYDIQNSGNGLQYSSVSATDTIPPQQK
jgi:Bax protein